MNDKLEFKEQRLAGGTELFCCRQEKFKTNLINLNIVRPLENVKKTTRTALLPGVLYRGSKHYPARREIVKKLDYLYGAGLNLSVLKRGIYQILSFRLEIVNDDYLQQQQGLFVEAIELLYELVFQPFLPDDNFSREYVEQEKKVLAAEIRGLVNDKYNYALERCIQEMCKEEPYGIYKLGSVKEIQDIEHEDLTGYYRQLFGESSLVFFVVGDFATKEVYERLSERFDINNNFREEKRLNFSPDNLQVKEVEENKPLNQSRVAMGYRTGITRSNDLYYPLLVYNGLLGGFPHSRLFRILREEENLVYYIQSQLESSYGLQFVNCGIEEKNYDLVRDLVHEQKQNIARGIIDKQEIEWTKKGLISRYRSIMDSNKGLIAQQLLGYINEVNQPLEDLIEKIKNVKIGEVKRVAELVKLDTIFFLRNGGAESNDKDLQ